VYVYSFAVFLMSHSIQTQNSYGPYNASSITHDTESDPHWSWFISGTKTNSVTDSPTLNALLMNLVFSLYFLIPDYLQVSLDPPCAKVRLVREWEIKTGKFCRYKSNTSSGWLHVYSLFTFWKWFHPSSYTVIQNFSQTGLQNFLKLCCAC